MPADPHPCEIAAGVYCLGTGRGIGKSNVYFVSSGSSWALIDAAWSSRAQLIQKAAESLFGARTRPTSILLTHIHPDHSGSALELARMWNLPVYVHPDELPLAAATYLPEFANPLDRWLIAPLMRVMPQRAVDSVLLQTSLTDVARSLDPTAGVPGLP